MTIESIDKNKGHSPYGGYFQGSASVAGTQATCLPKTTSYTALRQDQRQPRKTPVSHEIYHEPTQDMKCVQRPSPMLGDPYFQCGAGQGRGSFAEFSSSRSGLKYLSYRTSIEPETVVFKASSQTPASYTGPSSTTNECASTKACYESTSDYGTLPSLYTSIDQQSMMPREDPIVVEDTMETAWWPGKTRNANDQYQTNDGLPKFSVTQQSQDYGDIWSGSAPATTWTPQDAAQATISPKMLTLDLSSAPMSSSGSSQGTVISYSGSSSTPSIAENVPEVSAPETSPVLKQPVPIRPRRQMVPEPLPSPRIPLPILPSNDFNSAQVPRRRSLRNASTNLAQMKSSNAYSSATANSKNDSRRSEVVPPKSKMPKKINPKPTTLPEEPSWASSNLSTAAVQAAHHRDAKDDFLVKSKLAGMSYRYIRRKGKFSEAESTLRGRFRTLTKHKTARVRKPEWNDNDVRLVSFT